MRVLVTGGTGFIGSLLTRKLAAAGHEVTILTRSARSREAAPVAGFRYLQGDPTTPGPWQDAVAESDAVYNLAGKSIFERWTSEIKARIRGSRITTTRNVVEGLARHTASRPVLISASAVGYYGFRGDEILDESGRPGSDFLSELSQDWEKEAMRANESGARVVIARFGIVMGEGGGALGQMVPIFKKYVGGPLGKGTQWFSWIHREDLVDALLFALERSDLSGPVNCTSPNPVRNKELAHALGEALGRPAVVPTPGFMVKLALGEFGSVLLEGQRVIPRKLLDAGFRFTFPHLKEALEDILKE